MAGGVEGLPGGRMGMGLGLGMGMGFGLPNGVWVRATCGRAMRWEMGGRVTGGRWAMAGRDWAGRGWAVATGVWEGVARLGAGLGVPWTRRPAASKNWRAGCWRSRVVVRRVTPRMPWANTVGAMVIRARARISRRGTEWCYAVRKPTASPGSRRVENHPRRGRKNGNTTSAMVMTRNRVLTKELRRKKAILTQLRLRFRAMKCSSMRAPAMRAMPTQ